MNFEIVEWQKKEANCEVGEGSYINPRAFKC